MALSMEARHLIVQHAESRGDICALARVCKNFQLVAERALYNTLYLSGIDTTISVSNILAGQPRVAGYVEALTIAVRNDETTDEEEVSPHFPEEYWRSVGAGLRSAHRLLHLTVQVDFIGNSDHAWVLDGCQFRLRTFHCDLAWDNHLVGFLNDQDELEDLYILDFPYPADVDSQATPAEPAPPLSPPPPPVRRVVSPVPRAGSLPKLSVLECPTIDAVSVLVPRRPITRVKTCFATSDVETKRRELTALFVNLRLSTRPLVSLDLGDSSYSAEHSLNFLRHCVSGNRTMDNVRYLGTLALPVDGREVRMSPAVCYSLCLSHYVIAPEVLWFAEAAAVYRMHRSRGHGLGPSTDVVPSVEGGNERTSALLPNCEEGRVRLRLRSRRDYRIR